MSQPTPIPQTQPAASWSQNADRTWSAANIATSPASSTTSSSHFSASFSQSPPSSGGEGQLFAAAGGDGYGQPTSAPTYDSSDAAALEAGVLAAWQNTKTRHTRPNQQRKLTAFQQEAAQKTHHQQQRHRDVVDEPSLDAVVYYQTLDAWPFSI